jgi:hypothetical protein
MIGGGVMSDIPDWLVELAAQGDLDEDEASDSASESQASESSASSFQDSGSEAEDFDDTDIFSQSTGDEAVTADDAEEDEDTTQDLMVVLRDQVAAGAAEEGVKVEDGASRSFSLRTLGLLPWQQLVLTVLLFLDVVVIGLLILVMLGRVAIF